MPVSVTPFAGEFQVHALSAHDARAAAITQGEVAAVEFDAIDIDRHRAHRRRSRSRWRGGRHLSPWKLNADRADWVVKLNPDRTPIPTA
jgi:hypothetical protein